MFKKTTLALAVSGLLGASAAQAAMVYDQDGTTLDIYGRIAMGFEGGGAEENNVDNSEEFRNFGSRLRITAGHQMVIPPFLEGFKSRPQAIMTNFC